MQMVAVLDFFTKYFLVLSTAITSLLTAMTFIFIVSYLSVFDYSITLIIEYQDILKFVFISLGIMAGLSPFIYNYGAIFPMYMKGTYTVLG
jgi:hypothetical protein